MSVLAGNRIDRQAEKRSDAAVQLALADPAARIMLVRGGRSYLKPNGGSFDGYFAQPEAEALGAGTAEAILLGVDEQGPVLAATAGIEPEQLPETIKAIDYRSVYSPGPSRPLRDRSAGAGRLAACLARQPPVLRPLRPEDRDTRWRLQAALPCLRRGAFPAHRSGRHHADGDTRKMPAWARRAFRAGHVFRNLAGFIEPGETIEAAVRRETLEEAGIRLGRVVYHASQPWPFPYSLMIGCFGEALNEDIVRDEAELEDCRWFSRDEVLAALAKSHAGGVFVPPSGAIAHHLIRFWVENP